MSIRRADVRTGTVLGIAGVVLGYLLLRGVGVVVSNPWLIFVCVVAVAAPLSLLPIPRQRPRVAGLVAGAVLGVVLLVGLLWIVVGGIAAFLSDPG